MTPTLLLRLAIDPSLSLLPDEMTSDEARAMLLAIALQESGIQHRRQIGGPARGFWQFERAGVYGVMTHDASSRWAYGLPRMLGYPFDASALHEAIEHNDTLAAAVGRLLLWTLPDPLPGRNSPAEGWRQYIEAWRPGKPHRHTWNGHWWEAWETVDAHRKGVLGYGEQRG